MALAISYIYPMRQNYRTHADVATASRRPVIFIRLIFLFHDSVFLFHGSIAGLHGSNFVFLQNISHWW
jgi:hypothetical protein